MDQTNRTVKICRRINELENRLWFDPISDYERGDIDEEIFELNEELESLKPAN